jgi:hypothetical protein
MCNKEGVIFSEICLVEQLCGSGNKSKVMCTPVQALRLHTGRTAHRASRGIALLFHDQHH